MSDELLQTLLQKARGIEAAPPAEMEPVRQVLGGGIDLLKGATGLGNQGPPGPTMINAGELIGTLPVATIKALLKYIPVKNPGSIHEFLKMAWGANHDIAQPTDQAVGQALSMSRATPSMGMTRVPIRAPEGFELPSHLQDLATPNSREVRQPWMKSLNFRKPQPLSVDPESIRSLSDLSNITSTTPRREPPPLSGKWYRGPNARKQE